MSAPQPGVAYPLALGRSFVGEAGAPAFTLLRCARPAALLAYACRR